jgi:hypothetical protein
MEQKMYSVDVIDGCNLFVIAYSKEHAIVEIVKMYENDGVEAYPFEFSLDDVTELSKKEMKKIIIDYNYATNDEESDTLLNIFKDLTKFTIGKKEFFGVVGDDFIAY